MKKSLILAVAGLFCLALVAALISAKPIKSTKASKSAWLGVYTQSVDKDIADAFDVDVDHGAIINDVIADSPAEKAGLKDGDVIISFNGQKVWDQNDLTDFIDDADAGSKATIGVIRDGKEMTVKVELTSRPEGSEESDWNDETPHGVLFNGPKNSRMFSWGGGGYVGVQLADLTEQLANYFGVTGGQGVLITEVSKDSPAEKAGLHAGDVITSIDNDKVSEYGEVKEIVSGSKPGNKLSFSIVRDKKEQKLDVEVVKGKNDEYGYRFFEMPALPPIPDMDNRAPRARGNFNHPGDDRSEYFDYDSYNDDMKQFKADMEKYKADILELSKEMKRLKSADQTDLQKQIDELKAKLTEMEGKIK